jgi:uncharacterized protein (TIGR02588 family)
VQPPPKLERILGAVGAALVIASAGFLTYRGLTDEARPGALVVTVTEIRDVGDQYVATFAVHNRGAETLSQLHMVARVMDGETELESAPAVIDYLPAHSTQKAGVYLRHDPRRYRLEITPGGYMEP